MVVIWHTSCPLDEIRGCLGRECLRKMTSRCQIAFLKRRHPCVSHLYLRQCEGYCRKTPCRDELFPHVLTVALISVFVQNFIRTDAVSLGTLFELTPPRSTTDSCVKHKHRCQANLPLQTKQQDDPFPIKQRKIIFFE